MDVQFAITSPRPDRFVALGTVPLQAPELAVAELEYCMKLGFRGMEIGTDYPYDMGYYEPVDFVAGVKSLSHAQKDAIIGGNAVKPLKIRPRRRG